MSNVQRLRDALEVALADDKFMSDNPKVDKAIEALTPKDGVTKDLKQAFTHGENWWAKNVLNGNLEGCTKDNKLEKIKKHVLVSSSYHRHVADEKNKVKVDRWMVETFPVQAEPA